MTDKKTTGLLRKAGPSQVEGRASRPQERIPVGGMRDKLTVRGQRDDLSYRWVKDDNEDGSRIFEFLRAGWNFVQSTDVIIGQKSVYKTENVGSIVRHPAGDGEYLFLMAIPIEWYNEDQAAKQASIDALEAQILRPSNEEDDGQYGKNELKFGLGRQGEDTNLTD